jgi:hypothetical protein
LQQTHPPSCSFPVGSRAWKINPVVDTVLTREIQSENARQSAVSNRTGVCVCWPVSLRRRDQALAAIQESIMKQQQQELAIETEIQGYKKDIVKEQVGPLCLLT